MQELFAWLEGVSVWPTEGCDAGRKAPIFPVASFRSLRETMRCQSGVR
jgi:hypothetical protein